MRARAIPRGHKKVDESKGDCPLRVLDVVRAMAEEAKNGDVKVEPTEPREEPQKNRRRSRSPINGPGAGRRGRGRGGGRRYGGYRGWDRSADGIDNKTNSDEPHLKRARLFVGNIATDSVTRRDLAGLFGQYGRVLGVSIHGGFAFVQLDREKDANRAILCEDGQTFMGSKIRKFLFHPQKSHLSFTPYFALHNMPLFLSTC